MRKLKACPYCGGKAEINWPGGAVRLIRSGVIITIRCKRCGAESAGVNLVYGDDDTVKFGIKELDDTIAVWNRDKAD